ncbi:MAG: toprim domain-containing protein, partial [Deltaproteobacteria bacterium]|nr:toprim domain-containing protein [Deltaproteobacteria bacterium]
LSPHIILIYDGDTAGKKAAKRSIPLFLKEDILVDIALLPEGQDPDSFISQVGKEGFLNLLSQAKPLIDWYLASGEEETRDNFERRYQFLQEASNVIFQFKNPFKKSHYIGKLCQLFHVDQALIQDLHKNSRDISLGSDLLAAFLNSLTPDERFQLKTIRYLFSYPQMVHEFARENAFKEIVHPLFRQLLDLICEIYERKNELSLSELLLNTQEDIIKSLITKWAIETSPFKLEDGYEILRAIKQKRLKRERQKILTKIKDAEERKDFSEVLELLKEEKRLIKQTEAV